MPTRVWQFMVRRTFAPRPALALALLLALAGSAQALDPSDKWEGSIDYAATGGSFLIDTCQAFANMSTGEEGCNPGILDGQGDTMLTTSSGEMYGIPDGANVVKAVLIWMGSVNLGEQEPDHLVRFRPPNGFIVPVTGEEAQLQEIVWDDPGRIPGHFFTYRVDVTEILRDHATTQRLPLNGVYEVSGFDASADDYYKTRTLAIGGWSVIIVYSLPSAQAKRIYYYTDFRQIQDNIVRLTPAGFQVPEEVEAKVTFFLGEGDPNIRGGSLSSEYTEELTFNGEVLTDECNPEDNAYNSTVNTNIKPDERPCREWVHSIDLDTFDVSAYLEKGDTQAKVNLTLGQDAVMTNFLILSINTKLPDFDIPMEPEKTASVESGNALYPGQEFTYYIFVQNNGQDDAKDVRVRDSLPPDVTYIPNSTVVVEPGGRRRAVPDGPGGQAPCLAGIDIAETMPVGPDHRRTVEIGARLNTLEEGVTKETIVSNTAEIISNNGDVYFTNGGVPVQHTVQLESFEGRLRFKAGRRHPSSRFVMPGDGDVVAAHINLEAINGDVQFSSFRFTPVEETDAEIIVCARLYLDKNGDGRLDGGDVQIDGDASWSGGGLVFDDFGALPVIEMNEEADLLLLIDVSGEAAPGAMAQLELLQDGVSIRGFTEGLPFAAARINIPAEDTDASMELGPGNPGDAYVAPGRSMVAMQLAVRAYAPNVTIGGLTLSSEGSLHDPTEITELRLLRDMNGDGLVQPGELMLGQAATFSADNGAIGFTGFSVAVAQGQQAYLLVAADLVEGIGSDKKFRLVINNNEQLDAGSSVVAGAPVSGSLFTTRSGDVKECSNDLECSMALGRGWVCDQLEDICVFAGDSDGDLDDDDATVDGDDDRERSESSIIPPDTDGGGGGCQTGGAPALAILDRKSVV